MEGGSATLPINLVSPPTTTSPTEDPQPRVLPHWGGDPEVAAGSEPVFASHPRIQSLVVAHESPQVILWWTNPHRHLRSLMLLVLFPLHRHPASRLASST